MRIIWYVTGAIVLVCIALLGLREYWQKVGADEVRASTLSPNDTALKTMFALLADDPQARREPTRKAVQAVASMAGKNPASPEVYYALGLLKHGRADYAGGEKAYRKAIELKPQWSWPYNGLGILLFEAGRTDEAEEMFHKALELDPKWSRPHNDLAVLLRLAGRLDEAQQEALAALKLAPNNVATHNNYGNLLAAQMHLAEAEREYRRAIELDPEHPSPYYNLACLSSRQGRKDEALGYLKTALKLDPGFADEARHDPDLAQFAGDPAFENLLAGHK